MTPYQAMLAAADHIETNPDRFNFDSYNQPTDLRCGSPGCALGWIAYFIGAEPDVVTMRPRWLRIQKEFLWNFGQIAALYGAVIPDETTFYNRMDELECKPDEQSEWRDDPTLCADLLRQYAQKYVAPELAPTVADEGRRSVGDGRPVEEAVTND